MRGLAALSVVGYHAMLESAGKGYTDNVFQNFFSTSFLFVDFFFMLSGFIMVDSYQDKIIENDIRGSSIKYIKKRAKKILPNYYFWLLISIILNLSIAFYFENINVGVQCITKSIVLHSLLLQNLIGSCYFFNMPLWSIAVEFLAYLAFPFLIMIRPRAIVFAGAGFVIYVVTFCVSQTIDLIDGTLSVMRCFAGFICGMAASKIDRRSYPYYINILLLICLFYCIAFNMQIVSLILMFALTIVTADNFSFLAQFSRLKYPYLIGRASFSIYLAHIPVSMVLGPIAYKVEAETGIPFGSDWTLILPIKIIASGLVGVFAFQQVECRFSTYFERQVRPSRVIAKP